jgi:hypothetical protein
MERIDRIETMWTGLRIAARALYARLFVRWRLVCERCEDVTLPPAVTPRAAEQAARDAGWQIVGGQWLCADCSSLTTLQCDQCAAQVSGRGEPEAAAKARKADWIAVPLDDGPDDTFEPVWYCGACLITMAVTLRQRTMGRATYFDPRDLERLVALAD